MRKLYLIIFIACSIQSWAVVKCGLSTVGANAASNSGNRQYGYTSCIPAATGNINGACFYQGAPHSGSGNIYVGVWDVVGGVPTTLLCTSDSIIIGAGESGWKCGNVSATCTLTSGHTYAIGFNDDNGVAFQYDSGTSTFTGREQSQTCCAPPLVNFTTGTGPNSNISVYVTLPDPSAKRLRGSVVNH